MTTRDEHQHDPDATRALADSTLIQLTLNCKALDLCAYCTGMEMIAMMVDSLIKSVRHSRTAAADLTNAAAHFDALGVRLLEEAQSHDS